MWWLDIIVSVFLAENDDAEDTGDDYHTEDDADTNKNVTVVNAEIIVEAEQIVSDIHRQEKWRIIFW